MAKKNPNDNVEKAIEALQLGMEMGEETVVEIPDEKDVTFEPDMEITELADGGAEIGPAGDAPIDQSQIPFDANLAEYIDDIELGRLANDLLADFEADKDSRKDWEDTYIKGLDMLGFKYEDRVQPFEGASGVVHPLLAESVTQLQAQAYNELHFYLSLEPRLPSGPGPWTYLNRSGRLPTPPLLCLGHPYIFWHCDPILSTPGIWLLSHT